MKINSRALGPIEIDERQIITFPHGILGFESCTKFALLDASQPPFYWLQSLDNTETAFVMISPDVFRDDFELSLLGGELDVIGVDQTEDGDLILKDGSAAELLVLAIVTVSANRNEMSANLQGPVIINSKEHIGTQGIQTDGRWLTKHFILEEMNAKKQKAGGGS